MRFPLKPKLPNEINMATELNIQELVLPLERIQSQPFVISSSPDNVNEVETISPSSAFPTSSTHSGYLDT